MHPKSHIAQCVCCIFLLLCAMLPSAAVAQSKEAAARESGPGYVYREQHDPDGTGKFYLGREIARVMNYRGASWLERPERQSEEDPSLLLDHLNLRPGQVVADIGAGSGYFAVRLSRAVGASGHVFAVDIQPEMLEILKQKISEQGIENIEPILGDPTDPRLPANSIDLILMVDVYHEFSHPWEMMQKLCEAMKEGARIAIVEYRAEDPSVPIKPLHKMTEEQVKREMRPQPLRWVETLEALPRQHIIVFEKIPAPARN